MEDVLPLLLGGVSASSPPSKTAPCSFTSARAGAPAAAAAPARAMSFALPKSVSFRWPRSSSNRFSGFRSRCSTCRHAPVCGDMTPCLPPIEARCTGGGRTRHLLLTQVLQHLHNLCGVEAGVLHRQRAPPPYLVVQLPCIHPACQRVATPTCLSSVGGVGCQQDARVVGGHAPLGHRSRPRKRLPASWKVKCRRTMPA